MRRFILRHLDKVIGVLEGFDRLVFRGWLGRLCHEVGMYSFLASQGILLKDFEPFAKSVTNALRDQADAEAAKLGQTVRYLASPEISKEAVARQVIADRGIAHGPVCVLSAVEPCRTWEVRRSHERKHPQEFRRRPSKCLHYYHYFLDRHLGFMHVRVQSWFPFEVRVCINGREWLGRQLDSHRMRYERADNCFPWLASPEKAQYLMDGLLSLDWPRVLDSLTVCANPALRPIMDCVGGFYWTVWQSEWATDVMFEDRGVLEACYPHFVRHAMTDFQSPDVMRFLGRRLVPGYDGEIKTDYRRRIEGVRVKHSAKNNSVKMYDKFGRILRVEATITQPSEFKVRRKAQGNPHSPSIPRPLRRGVQDIRRLARTGQAITHRYLDALAPITIDTPLEQILEPVTRTASLGKQKVRGLKPWSGPDSALLQAIGRGEFLTNGFRNRDLLTYVCPGTPDEPSARRKAAAKVTRQLRLLRAHGLVARVEGTHRYTVTDRGRAIVSAFIALRTTPLSALKKCA